MGIVERLLGPDRVPDREPILLGARTIGIDDLVDVHSIFAEASGSATYHRFRAGNHDELGDEVPNLDRVSPRELSVGISVAGWHQSETRWPVLLLNVGPMADCRIFDNGRYVVEAAQAQGYDDAVAEADAIREAEEAAIRIARAQEHVASLLVANGRRRFDRLAQARTAQLAVWIVATALTVWTAVSTWPSVVLAILGATAYLSAAFVFTRHIRRVASFQGADFDRYRFRILPTTRAEYRDRRWTARVNWIGVSLTAAVTTVITAIVTAIVTLWLTKK